MKNKTGFAWTRLVSLALAVFLLGSAQPLRAGEAGTLTARYLRCENKVDPLGIDAASPRLSWIVVSEQRSRKQTAYQIMVSSSRANLEKNLADLWDSGKVRSDATAQIVYQGKPLASGRECFWKVMVWDNNDRASAWSEPAKWSMGLQARATGRRNGLVLTRPSAPWPRIWPGR
jgi:alpha-L-rhamnosidase